LAREVELSQQHHQTLASSHIMSAATYPTRYQVGAAVNLFLVCKI